MHSNIKRNMNAIHTFLNDSSTKDEDVELKQSKMFEQHHKKAKVYKKPNTMIKSYVQKYRIRDSNHSQRTRQHFKRSFDRRVPSYANRTNALTGLMTYAESIKNNEKII